MKNKERKPMSKKKKIWIIVLASVAALAIAAGILIPVLIAKNKNKNESKTLAEAYADYFPVGVALNVMGEGADSYKFLYEDDLISQFASITAENEMKWYYTEPRKGNFTFDKGDFIVKKAKELGMKVRGHALVWHESTPDYVANDAKDDDPAVAKAKVLDDITTHVFSTVTHFSQVGGDDVVYCWDVVNEAISDSGNPNEIFRSSAFYDAAGIDFIKTAFRAARAANPNIKLYYNDYNLNQPIKRAKAIQLIKTLQQDGVPIDGIGEQAHYNIRNFDVKEFEQMIADFRELGLDVQITELDLSVYDNADEKYDYLSPELSKLQAEVCGKIMEICRKNKDIVKGVTFWGAADDHTWLTNWKGNMRYDYPLLFDESLEPKDAYYAVMDFSRSYSLDSEKADDPEYSVYRGAGDFHIANDMWYGGDLATTGLVISYDNINIDGSLKVHYSKIKEYTEVVTKFTGDMRGFKYLNFTLRASKDISVMAQMNYYIGYGETNDKVLGEEPFDVTTEKKVYSIKIPDSRSYYINLLDEIWLFPEPGETKNADNKTLSGDLFIYDTWFSAEAPAAADKIVEPNASGSGVSEAKKKCNGYTWYNETSWSKIKMSATADGMRIAASGAAEWSFVSVQLNDFELTDNRLEIKFTDPNDSVSYIRFRLRGTPTGMNTSGVYPYMEYCDKDFKDIILDPAWKEEGGYVKQAGLPKTLTYDAEKKEYTLVYEIDQEVATVKNMKGLDGKSGIDLSEDGYGLRLVILIETVGVSISGGQSTDYAAQIVYPNYYSVAELRGKPVGGDDADLEGIEGVAECDRKFDITVKSVTTYHED